VESKNLPRAQPRGPRVYRSMLTYLPGISTNTQTSRTGWPTFTFFCKGADVEVGCQRTEGEAKNKFADRLVFNSHKRAWRNFLQADFGRTSSESA
jgi:hypothetical protein